MDLAERLRQLDFSPTQTATALADEALATAWITALDESTRIIYNPPAFVWTGIRDGQYPKGYGPAPKGQQIRAAAADRDEAVSMPREENRTRMAVLNRAMQSGGFTPDLLAELYEGDPAGRLAHDYCQREFDENGEMPDENAVRKFMLDMTIGDV